MKIGYFIIAILYIILAIAYMDLAKISFWVYTGVALMYFAMSDAVPLGIKLD